MNSISDYYGYFVGMLWVIVGGALILIAGFQIGAAVAHNDQMTHDHRMECIQNGGNIEYEVNVGTICKKD